MPDLSDLVPSHFGQVENFYLLVHGQGKYNSVYNILINYYELPCCTENSVDPDQLPADLDLHCFTRELISGFILFSKDLNF